MKNIAIRNSRDSDRAALDALYPRAFPEEELRPLLWQLLDDRPSVLSLVAIDDEGLVGHVIFTRCTVDPGGERAALLGPLCVSPERQREGIGGALIRAGLDQLGSDGIGLICVLGDPAYYGRHGFTAETGVATPHPIPDDWRDAWQSQSLQGTAVSLEGTLTVPTPWRDPALWSD